MITITRRQARRLRAVFRRSVLGVGHRGAVPPLVFRADGAELRAEHRYNGLAVAHAFPSPSRPAEAIAFPLDALADVEGRDDSLVVLEALAPDRTVARWQDHGVPQCREYVVPALDALAPFPEAPPSWTELPCALLDALAEAAATCADDNTRYALNCIQLRGDAREIVATDGRQLLVHGGFAFPWRGDVLVKRSPLFANKEIPRDRPVSVGKTDAHVVLRAGAWTCFLEVQADARFPRVDQAVPDASAATTRLSLDAVDAAFLAQALDRLPGADDANAPATLDLNGKVAVRAKGSELGDVTELILSRSGYTGAAVRLNVNREFLTRAVRLGLSEFEVADAESPVALRGGGRVYCFQPLSKESAIAPTDAAARIESPSAGPRPALKSAAVPKGESPVPEKTTPFKPVSHGGSTPIVRTETVEGSAGGGLAALIQEAEALHEVLTDARVRAGRMTVTLRRYRRRERLVSNTLASLKALKLQDVAG